jgi:general secretion pathway protein J
MSSSCASREIDPVRHNRSRGFTLIEVMIALVILSLIMVATLSALRTFGNTQTSLDRMVARVDEIRTVSAFLRDTLAAAPRGGETGGGLGFGGTSNRQPGYFRGNSGELVWKAPVIFGTSYGGTMLLRLVQDQDSLVLQWQKPPAPISAARWDDSPSRVLVEDLQEFQVSYRPRYDAETRSKWKGPDAPAQVSLVIKASERYWPELIVQVQP